MNESESEEFEAFGYQRVSPLWSHGNEQIDHSRALVHELLNSISLPNFIRHVFLNSSFLVPCLLRVLLGSLEVLNIVQSPHPVNISPGVTVAFQVANGGRMVRRRSYTSLTIPGLTSGGGVRGRHCSFNLCIHSMKQHSVRPQSEPWQQQGKKRPLRDVDL